MAAAPRAKSPIPDFMVILPFCGTLQTGFAVLSHPWHRVRPGADCFHHHYDPLFESYIHPVVKFKLKFARMWPLGESGVSRS
jgi:hypothetical protein